MPTIVLIIPNAADSQVSVDILRHFGVHGIQANLGDIGKSAVRNVLSVGVFAVIYRGESVQITLSLCVQRPVIIQP